MSQGQNPILNRLSDSNESDRWEGFKARWKYYAVATVVIFLALAWIDGGEEPLRPITQSVDLAGRD